ncbi:MAG TPA: thioredoxin-dependent thiol peroxidase [Methanotrichaceae archaeon]|nr:thioredoxin-dependent thiol peroxidase [Methanotrichaceae archaeon]
MVEVGDAAPEFCLPAGDEQEICLNSYHGKWVILYFYPKDNTSGCTREAVDFTAALDAIHTLGADVLGISRDTPASHRKFAEKHELEVKLLSDPDHEVMDAYGVWALKKMYGREGYGVVRSTFLIDPDGHIAHIWRSVKVKGHVETVLNTLNAHRIGCS